MILKIPLSQSKCTDSSVRCFIFRCFQDSGHRFSSRAHVSVSYASQLDIVVGWGHCRCYQGWTPKFRFGRVFEKLSFTPFWNLLAALVRVVYNGNYVITLSKSARLIHILKISKSIIKILLIIYQYIYIFIAIVDKQYKKCRGCSTLSTPLLVLLNGAGHIRLWP